MGRWRHRRRTLAAKDSPEDAACIPGNTVSDIVIAVKVPGGLNSSRGLLCEAMMSNRCVVHLKLT